MNGKTLIWFVIKGEACTLLFVYGAQVLIYIEYSYCAFVLYCVFVLCCASTLVHSVHNIVHGNKEGDMIK